MILILSYSALEMCRDAFDLDIEKRLEDALKNDKSNTQEMSS